jgi:hypothetical protein
VTPAVIIALVLFALWAAIVSVVIWRRSPPVVA